MRLRLCLLFVLGVVLVGGWAKPSFAQGGASTAQVNGSVRDESGGSVGKTDITLREMDTNRGYTVTTNSDGFYAIPNVPPGRYELKVAFTGFANFTQTGLVLTVGQTAAIDVVLKVASKGEQVVVSSETPVIEATKTEISQVIETKQIGSLPINGRLFTDFALLTPGVATSRTSLGTTFTDFETTQISFGGMRSFSNEITVDGADFVSALTGVQRATPPQESAQEFRVVNNSFSVEDGRAIGGIVNIVTKSGTNDLHGSMYEYFQNNAMDARSLLQPAPLPRELRQNQFGGTLSGPLKKDRTFFFINYEGKRRAESPVYPPDLINNLTLVDDAKAVLGLAPEGCTTGLSTCNGTNFSYLNAFLKTADDDWGFVRLDHQISANNRLGVRYNVEDTRALGELVGQTLDGGGIGTPSGGRNLFIRDQSLFGTLDSSLKPSLINSVLVQWARRHYNFPGATGQPDFSILNDLELGHNFGTDDSKYESRVQFSDSVSWVKGKHVWKFGFDGNYIKDLDNFPGFTPVRMLIPGLGCMADFAKFYHATYTPAAPLPVDVLAAATGCGLPPASNGVVVVYAGVPLPTDPSFTSGKPLVTAANPLNTSTWANAFPPALFSNYSHEIDHGYWAGFIQDQWRITPKFSLNYGLRWEYESGLSRYVDPDYNGWQPRVGFAYSPNSKTVIRGGFGLFDDRYNMTFFFIPNTQKVVPGYLCGNHAPTIVAADCAAAGVLPQELPMIQSNLGQASQGYQLFASPNGAAAIAANIIATGGYDAFTGPGGNVTMAGTCLLPHSTPGPPYLACGVGSGGMEHNSRIPYSEQASLEIDRQIGGGFALSVSYLFVGAHNLVRGNNLNVPCPVGTTKSGPPTDPLTIFPGGPGEWVPGLLNADGTRSACTGTPTLGAGALAGLGPFFGGALNSGLQTISAGLLDYNNDVAKAVYHGLTISALEKLGKYFYLNANYTYSHTIDNGNFTTFINLPVNQFDYAMEHANSNQDLRQRFVTNFTADAPTKGWYRNFQFSSIITVETGRPFTLFYGGDTFNDLAGGATDRVGGAPFSTSQSACPSVDHCQTVIARNTYIGDNLRSWDLRVSRYFRFREKARMDLALDVFNAFNRPNVDEVTSVYGSPVFCGTTPTIPRHYNDATTIAIQQGAASTACPAGPIPVPGGSLAPTPIPGGEPLFVPSFPNPSFGKPRTMMNPRQLQLSLKLSF